MHFDSKGLYDTSCNSDDCPDLDQLHRQIQARCSNVANTIQDASLASCIKKKCESGKITCQKTCPPGWRGYYDPSNSGNGANICIASGSQFWSQPDPSATVIHEWAHQCGWEHGMGMGVPNDPGAR